MERVLLTQMGYDHEPLDAASRVMLPTLMTRLCAPATARRWTGSLESAGIGIAMVKAWGKWVRREEKRDAVVVVFK